MTKSDNLFIIEMIDYIDFSQSKKKNLEPNPSHSKSILGHQVEDPFCQS